MIQYVIASHGGFARAGLEAAAMLFGEIPTNFHVLSLEDGGRGIACFEEEAAELAGRLREAPVLILADLFGGSPFMTLLSAFRHNEYKLISGFNLPMIVEALSLNGEEATREEAARQITENGRDVGIRLVDKLSEEGEGV